MNRQRFNDPKLYDAFASVIWFFSERNISISSYIDSNGKARSKAALYGFSVDQQVKMIPRLLKTGAVDIVAHIKSNGDIWYLEYFSGISGELTLVHHKLS